ncbi:MAG: toxin-antitoxin system HicB family antitoxin [Peptostreptococcales bacterium]
MAKTERLFIRITPELKTKLQEQAEKEHRSLSNYIEKILIKELKEQSRE